MLHALILAGGRGARLWPMSRAARPKHVAKIFDGQSLLDLAVHRANAVAGPQRVWICSNNHIRPHAAKITGFDPVHFIEEPFGKDTLAAIALSSAVINAADPDAIVSVLTADHLIRPVDRFAHYIQSGCQLVSDQAQVVVTFSIRPTSPDTGYGYIERGRPHRGSDVPAFDVAQYVEKPSTDQAARFIAGGRHGWSAGMFAFRAAHFLELVDQIDPGACDTLRSIGRQWGTSAADNLVRRWYEQVKQTSVDYAIMMPASRGQLTHVRLMTIPMDLDWIDVGTFERFAQVLPSDDNSNTIVGPSALARCRDVIALSESESHLVAAIGCENLVIVHTADVTFVCPRNRLDELKGFVDALDDRWT